MAVLFATMMRVSLLLLAIGCISAKRFSIMAPNVFHIGVEEKVSISIFDNAQPVTVKLYLQDFPHRQKTFSQVQGVVEKGGNIFLTVKVKPDDLPDKDSVDKQFVYLVAKSDDAHFQFQKEAKILLSYRNGMVFIQTDKPIYTPRQSVKFRVIPVEFDMKPSLRKITVMVLNPQGIRVQQWKDLDTSTGIISERIDLGDFILHGNWTITAVYGHQNIHNTSVQFEVKEYVLPKFSVKLRVPPYILKTDNKIAIDVTARYTYGKPVIGTVVLYMRIAGFNGENILFSKQSIMLNSSGVTTISQKVQVIRELPGDLWFPEKSRLEVQADVIERATGNTATVVDKTCQFTSSPYLIQFKDTPKYFKPGLRFVVKAKVTYPNKKPARNVPIVISAQGKVGNRLIDVRREERDPNAVLDETDKNGEAEFVIDACTKCDPITITVKTDNKDLEVSQNAEAVYLVRRFDSENAPLIMVRQLTPGKVGRKIQCESYRSLNDVAAKLSFAVISRGRILSHDTTDDFDGMFKSWNFRITAEMSPSARLIAYYIDSNERVVADSVLLKIEDKLPTEVEFPDAFSLQADETLVQLNEIEKLPGQHYVLQIKAPQGTRLGLLSVDQSVYLLRNENRLTKERIFKSAEQLDLGCGVGGGKNNKDIFKVNAASKKPKVKSLKEAIVILEDVTECLISENLTETVNDLSKNAGVVLMTNNFVSDGREDYGCDENNARKKRSAEDDLVYKTCCEMGEKKSNRSCADRVFSQENKECKEAFWKCCTKKYGSKDAALLGRSVGDFGPSDEEILDQTQIRSFFPETWIYDEKVVGPGGLVQMDVTIPDTITTWVMQAVAINNKTGLGLATPLRIVGKRDFFISLKIPYSVKRGEQVSLLVTVFNYHDQEMQVKLYLKGDKDFCSIALDRKLTLIGRIKVPDNDARSVAVPIVPKRIGEIEVEVSSILQVKINNVYMNIAGDAVRRKVFVVPEGVEHRKSQSFILDPAGNLNDGPKDGEEQAKKPTVAPFESQSRVGPHGQLDSIKLKFPEKAIPGSVGAVVYLTAEAHDRPLACLESKQPENLTKASINEAKIRNLLGPVVNTTIEGGLEKFFQQPTGCGEQTMIYLAPNVYVLEYLMNTNQLSGANEENAYRFIQSGYQRELNYRRNDNSFSAWGNSRPGSTWLTAFVMRVFCQAQKFAGVNIDQDLVCTSVGWLVANQRADGALPEVNAVIHREMVGGVYVEGDVAMTAFVLAALAECKCGGVNSKASILRAQDYLEKQYKTLNKPYSMALTAYALALVNSPERFNANDRLVQRAIYDNDKKSRHWNAGGNALNVETAGYVLLTQVILGRTGYAGSIVTYLTNQRQGGVGFVSTQDTVVALQALALYSEKTAGNALDLRVKLTSESDVDWKPPEIHFTPENALLRREYNIKNFLGGDLYVDSRGTGVGLLEVEVRYNLPSSRGEICKFILTTKVEEIKENEAADLFGPVQDEADEDEDKGKGKDDKKNRVDIKQCKKIKNKQKKRECRKKAREAAKNKDNKGNKKNKKPPPKHQPVKSIHLKVCTRYKEKGNTGMSIMDIGILTGFTPDIKSLNKLEKNLPELDKYEVSDRSLVVYLSEIPSDRELCVDVQFDREYYVGVVQAVPVNVYDYYEPDQSCSVFYGPDKFSPLKLGVCDVGRSSCKCSQDQCAQQDPPIGKLDKLMNLACGNYEYVIKGEVLLVDENNAMLTYTVEVKKIIKQGNKNLKVTDKIDFSKRGSCQSPDLKEREEYLFMGLDNAGKYELDQNSFIKLWPAQPNNKDKLILDQFADQFVC